MNSKIVALIGALGVLAAACQLQAPAKAPPRGGPQAWIDAPLTDAVLPLKPYEVIAHATNPKGIVAFEFSVNGQVQKTSPVDPGRVGKTLAQLNQTWNPPAVGTYLLAIRASEPDGAFGPPAEVRVRVGEQPAETPLPTAAAPSRPTVPAPTQARPAGVTPLPAPTSASIATNTPTRPQPQPATATPTRPQPRTSTPTPTQTRRLIILPPGLFVTPTRTHTPIPPPR